MHERHYLKFAVMMGISFITMYAAMFFNVDEWGHIMLSANRTYMALLMVAPMAITMPLLMRSMYHNKKANALIMAGAVVVFVGSFILLRTQTPITDIQYMRGMIPHHSSAIMTSRHATLRDPETQALAKSIIESQEREITQMKALIQRLEQKH
jgi:uncharacterized protein (DUF305 family)